MARHYIVEGLARPGPGATFVITGDEARHAVAVSRLRAGERVSVSDGCGLIIAAEVLIVEKSALTLTCIAVDDVPAQTPAIVLVQALAKGDRDERAIEAATELGVSRVIPWQASRSVSRWEGERAEKGRLRWASIVREASKQSIRAWVPQVERVYDTSEVASLADATNMIVLDPSGSLSIGDALDSLSAASVILVVGPEGGLSPEEVETFKAAGARVVGLGANILRTSTAGPAALAVINELTGRW